MLIAIFIIFIIIGLCIGVLSGFFGVGGGFVLTPLLLLLHYDPISAITISLLYTIGTSLSGVFVHIQLKNIIWKDAFIMGLSGIVMTQAAHPFVLYIEKIDVDTWLIPLVYILLLAYFAYKMIREHHRESFTNHLQVKSRILYVLFLIVIGMTGGFMSTMLGVGGGFIIVPLLISFLHYPANQAVGTSLFAVLFIVIIGFLTYIVQSPIDLMTGALLIAGGLIGAQAGAKSLSYFRQAEVQKRLGLLYIVTLMSLLLKLMDYQLAGLILLCLFVLYLLSLLSIRAVSRTRQSVKQ
ncbi:sulfite exporter TauE/SafE family protein [Metabacillus arenae]|uniref:Probable membrane transporter protein n=1 Tax=Metabacillus arenae TaxID=2771434 RepID=A0A926NFH1_9BACI|nr:sulfite exporter TauE/SafE family protein [Metabacillus arenae]MBD1379043.1 sulfite exporter TauE/SafE family protein [Metabacillus arenae]